METVLKTLPLIAPPIPSRLTPISIKFPKSFYVSFRHRILQAGIPLSSSLHLDAPPSIRFVKLFAIASSGGETEKSEAEATEQVQETDNDDSSDGAVAVEDAASDESSNTEEIPTSAVLTLLQSYKEALANKDESKVTELELFLKSIADEKVDLENKVVSLSKELAIEKDRILRISAAFSNFRNKTERERLSLVRNAQREVVESFLRGLDNFERAKSRIKVATVGEEKINNNYHSIYKQFIEILGGRMRSVVPAETVGNSFGSKFSRVLDELSRFISPKKGIKRKREEGETL